MAVILHAINLNFDNILDQIFTSQEVPPSISLTTPLLYVTALIHECTEAFAMYLYSWKGGHGNREGHGSRRCPQ